ncbi:hypothetical protein Pyn_12373 [Prunus yedoensis var. nudiflora]|uniref:Uncharacterized protein n=1 Tax=Prunus yedoensis var. nudiflora TaxID=2094558 RepID=A0A314Y3H5_PRUYE|nr:hypothetical protein Pyn_12373 [Prunus yedoensis var. nudiflora]
MNLSNETNAAADEIEVEDVQAAQPKQASLEQLMIQMLEKMDNQAKAFQVGRKLMVKQRLHHAEETTAQEILSLSHNLLRYQQEHQTGFDSRPY